MSFKMDTYIHSLKISPSAILKKKHHFLTKKFLKYCEKKM